MCRSIHNLNSSFFSILLSNTSIFQTFVSLLFLITYGESLYFNMSHFDAQNIVCSNDSTLIDGQIQMTKNAIDENLDLSVGRASYSKPIRLWDKSTRITTNFTTYFSFKIIQLGTNPVYYNYGDGIAFFMAPFENSTEFSPNDSEGGCLGLIGGHDKINCSAKSEYPFVAIEFDTFNNEWEKEGYEGPSYVHLGIDVNSVISKVELPWNNFQNESIANVWVNYDSSTKNLSIFLTYDDKFLYNGESSLSDVIDLASIFPEKIRVGFTSSTGVNHELHYIVSWDFNSTLEDNTSINVPTPQESQQNHTISTKQGTKGKTSFALLGGIIVGGFGFVTIGLSIIVFILWKRRLRGRNEDINSDMSDDFGQEIGPRRFTYNEISQATDNFNEERKLGEGGFGDVYKGILTNIPKEIAVKKISKGSTQGRKEYISEVKTITCLRHKNLVQLLGWCHERGELLLVYEYMPNGSLDSHLFKSSKTNTVLPWTERYKIAQGLASGLLYLHEEWEQCVLHRDIKSSNVMLDSNFNTKLGDFGLARLVDHNVGSQTTVLAGTLGYLAPECVLTGKATKESDVYSFGVVALEIACGRRAIEPEEEPNRVRLIDWVWTLYGENRLQESIDERLEREPNIQEIECLLISGLWCCHPEYKFRPSIRQVINVLNMESPLPSLPMELPILSHSSYAINGGGLFNTSSSSGIIGSSSGTILSSSSRSIKCGATPLLSEDSTMDVA